MNDRHLLVRYNVQRYIADKYKQLSVIDEYVSIIDNDAFPQHMSPITVPLSVKTLQRVRILGSSYGVICFHGYHEDYPNIDSEMVVFWNPSIRKSVSVLLEPQVRHRFSRVGFGVCPETRDPKLVKIDDVGGILEVQVYTLSTRAWKKVSLKPPYRPCGLMYQGEGVCVEGFIYWPARDDMLPRLGNVSNSIVSFDLSNDEFGKVYLPSSLQRSERLMLSKLNECLIVFEYFDIYGQELNYQEVWMMKDDGVTPSFTKMFHIESIFSKYSDVLELRKNGEAIIVTTRYANNEVDPILQVYDPCSGRVADIELPWSGHENFKNTFSQLSISSYMETLLLLDQ
nr:hypothetical protein [Tanacetum cinerariifolium]